MGMFLLQPGFAIPSVSGMSRAIVTYDELTEAQKFQATSLGVMAFGNSATPRDVNIERKGARCLSDYFGMFAIENGDTVGQVNVYRFDYVFPGGRTEKIAGLAGVTTRADMANRGIAKEIIKAVHRRERDAGIKHSILWTSPSWHAHELYVELGYSNIYSIQFAMKILSGRLKGKSGLRLAAARKADLELIGVIHSAASAGGTGFVRRDPGLVKSWVELGFIDVDRFRLIKNRGETIGYAFVEVDSGRVVCRELVVLPEHHLEDGIGLVEALAGKGGLVLFRDVLTPETASVFQSCGYKLFPSTWHVLMGARLGRRMSETLAKKEFGTGSEDFRCQSGDVF